MLSSCDSDSSKHPNVVFIMADDWSRELVDVRLTEKAVAFLENHMREYPDDPFFLYFVPSSPHIPWMVPGFMKGAQHLTARYLQLPSSSLILSLP